MCQIQTLTCFLGANVENLTGVLSTRSRHLTVQSVHDCT